MASRKRIYAAGLAAVIAALALTAILLLTLPKSSDTSGDALTATTTSEEEVSPRTTLDDEGLPDTPSDSATLDNEGLPDTPSDSAALDNEGLPGMPSVGGGGISESIDGSESENTEELDEDDGKPLTTTEGSVKEDVEPFTITEGSVTYDGKDLPYFHCGPLPSDDNPDLTELVMLHGAAFRKEDWKNSGILDMFCDINNEEDEGNLSISALDLPVSSNGEQLGLAFDSLVSNKILSGRAATFVSPSAGGRALVSLGEMASNNGNKELTRIVKAWIPVASGGVLGASDSTLLQYKSANIPILAIHGDQDDMGKRVTEKLKSLNDAKGVELKGRHPVYLDSPKEFVQEVLQFLKENGL